MERKASIREFEYKGKKERTKEGEEGRKNGPRQKGKPPTSTQANDAFIRDGE